MKAKRLLIWTLTLLVLVHITLADYGKELNLTHVTADPQDASGGTAKLFDNDPTTRTVGAGTRNDRYVAFSNGTNALTAEDICYANLTLRAIWFFGQPTRFNISYYNTSTNGYQTLDSFLWPASGNTIDLFYNRTPCTSGFNVTVTSTSNIDGGLFFVNGTKINNPNATGLVTPMIGVAIVNNTSPRIGERLNITFNATDATGLASANITYNMSGVLTKVNFTLSGTSAEFSNVTTITVPRGSVINFTGYVTSTSGAVKQNSTLVTIVDTPGSIQIAVNDTSPNGKSSVNITGLVADSDGDIAFGLVLENQTGAVVQHTVPLSGTLAQFSQVVSITRPRGTVVNVTVAYNDSYGAVVQNSSIFVVADTPPALALTVNASSLRFGDVVNITGVGTDPDGDFSTGRIAVNLSGVQNFTFIYSGGGSFSFSQNVTISVGRSSTVNLSVFMNDTFGMFVEVSTVIEVSANSWCFQETANVSSHCANGMGSYGFDNAKRLFNVNYSKPSNVTLTNQSVWSVRYGKAGAEIHENLTIPFSCWNQNTTLVSLFAVSAYDVASFYCNNGSWDNPLLMRYYFTPAGNGGTVGSGAELFDANYSSGAWAFNGNWYKTSIDDGNRVKIFEEAMWWHVLNNAAPSVSNVSISPLPANIGTDVRGHCRFSDADMDAEDGSQYIWWVNKTRIASADNQVVFGAGNLTLGSNLTFSCRKNDSFEWSSWVNSSTTLVGDEVNATVRQVILSGSTIGLGNDVTVLVNASDNGQVSGIIMELAQPSSGKRNFTMELAGGTASSGQWRYVYTTFEAGIHDLVFYITDSNANRLVYDDGDFFTVVPPVAAGGGGGGGGGGAQAVETCGLALERPREGGLIALAAASGFSPPASFAVTNTGTVAGTFIFAVGNNPYLQSACRLRNDSLSVGPGLVAENAISCSVPEGGSAEGVLRITACGSEKNYRLTVSRSSGLGFFGSSLLGEDVTIFGIRMPAAAVIFLGLAAISVAVLLVYALAKLVKGLIGWGF